MFFEPTPSQVCNDSLQKGVESRRRAPKVLIYGEGVLQTTNKLLLLGGESRSGTKILRRKACRFESDLGHQRKLMYKALNAFWAIPGQASPVLILANQVPRA